jgi:hypothetical protein
MYFITNDAMMGFSMDPRSLCQYICSEIHIRGGLQGEFWQSTRDKGYSEANDKKTTHKCYIQM